MKRFIEGEARTRVTLLPECLDDYVTEENPVRRRPQIAQCLYAGAFAAVAEDHSLAVFEQTLRTVQADTLAGTGDEDRGCGRGHEWLASRLEQNYTSDEA